MNKIKEVIKKILWEPSLGFTKKRLVKFFLLILIIFLFQINIPLAKASEMNTIDEIKIKRAKPYAVKFCNAYGIGLSKESSIKIAIEENSNLKYNPSLWLELKFKQRNDLKEISNEDLVTQIAEEIFYKCGNAIGLNNQNNLIDLKNEILIILNDSSNKEES